MTLSCFSCLLLSSFHRLGVVAYARNLSTQEAEPERNGEAIQK